MVPGPILHAHFNAAKVVASILIAAIASYSGLTLAQRLGARHGRDHWLWLAGGGAAMGLGIAAMTRRHARHAAAGRRDLTYDRSRVAISVTVAVAATAIALSFRLRFDDDVRHSVRRVASAIAMGLAVALMHYTGMWAVQFASAAAGARGTASMDPSSHRTASSRP